MADYDLEAKITADASGYEAGVKKAEKASKKLSTSVSKVIQGLGKNGLVGALGAVGLASSGLSATLGSVVKIARKVSETMNECTNAYKTQLIAERELDTAIQNNPFVSGASADALKQFASEMQKVSNYGDEELIPMMANLVSLGRTEAETMQIMSVAMDMSAGMGISLDSAITQLNATLNGNIGRLGQQNAELKGLTEEELKQGKAIEILGEKFKGLSSATADTSKQLQNIKGDFKEALGQFTLPSSDMWNKFWTGFYEKGIAVLKKIDDWMDTSIIGEKMAENIEAQLKKVKGDKNKTGYAREAVSVITERELELLIKYLEGQKKLNANEKIMLEVAKERAKSIEYMNNIEKQYLDDLAEEKRLKEEAEAREKELAELRKKQEEEEAERQKQLAIQKEKEQKMLSDWQGKLFSIRIENLERQRELELKNEELTEEQKEDISKFYGEQILAMRLQQIEKNREEALNAENVTEEARLAINLYYDNEITKAKQEEEKKRYKAKKEELEEEEKEEKKVFSAIIKIAQEATKKIGDSFKKIADTFKKVVSTIKNVFNSGFNLIKKLVSINVSDMLDNILAFEDAVLTFFVETLPKLPAFVDSVVQSIGILLKTLNSTIKRENVAETVFQIFKTIGDNLPELVENLLDILEKVFGGALDGLLKWLDEGDGINTILNVVLSIQKAVEKFVTEGLDDIVTVIENHVDDLANFLAESMASANRTLPSLIRSILRLINALIQAIAKAFENEDFVNSIVESIEGVIDALIEILPRLIGSIIKLIFNIINAIIPKLPEIILHVVQAIGDALPDMAEQIAGNLSNGISRIFSSIFTVDFWGSILQGFGEVLAQIIKSALSGGLNLFSDGGGSSSGGSSGSGEDREWYKKAVDPFNWFWHANGTNNAPAGLSVVGEAGPELVRFRGGEQVLNAHNTQKALEGMGGNTNNFNVTFNNLQDTSAFTMIQQLKQYNRQMAINGVI